jgi:hypothetical protein
MKAYDKLRKKYRKLPSWKWIEKNFEVKRDASENILIEIRKAVIEKFEGICDTIESLLTGETLYAFVERSFISSRKRDEIFETLKKLQALIKEGKKISLEFDEKEHADWISRVKISWEEMKPFLRELFDTLSKGWENYKGRKKETSYYG